MRIWNTATGKMHNKIEEHKEICSSVGWLPDSRRFITGANDSLMVWDPIEQYCWFAHAKENNISYSECLREPVETFSIVMLESTRNGLSEFLQWMVVRRYSELKNVLVWCANNIIYNVLSTALFASGYICSQSQFVLDATVYVEFGGQETPVMGMPKSSRFSSL